MGWIDIVGYIATFITSVGGISAIITWIISFSANKIAERLNKKFQESLDERLEKYKSELNKKEYVSKTKFDTEFSLYRKLSLDFANMVTSINLLVSDCNVLLNNPEIRLEDHRQRYQYALSAVITAQATLNSNIPFISEEIYNGYDELRFLAVLQLSEFSQMNNNMDKEQQEEKECFGFNTHRVTNEINEKWKKLNNTIRKYISTLEVMEDK